MLASDAFEKPCLWSGRRPARLWQWLLGMGLVLLSGLLQVEGMSSMMPVFGAVDAPVESPLGLYLYYVGFGLGVAVLLAAIVLLCTTKQVAVAGGTILIGRQQIARASVSLLLLPWKRLGRVGRLIEIRAGTGQVWRLGGPCLPPASRSGAEVAMPSWNVDAILGAVELDEISAALDLPGARPLLPGRRFEVTPFRATALNAIASLWPWWLTLAFLVSTGPTVGPLLAHTPAGQMVLPPLTAFIAFVGIAATVVAYHRPWHTFRCVLGPHGGDLMVVDRRSGALATSAPIATVRFETFHYALLGRYERLVNPGLRLTFPDGFVLALALPWRGQRWPGVVPRARAPRWTLMPNSARTLLAAMPGSPPSWSR